jgi:hypothetical protein
MSVFSDTCRQRPRLPVDNAQKLYDAVGSKDKTIKIFKTEDGGAE